MLNNILISRETRKVLSKDNRFIGIEGENLQEILVFNLDEKLDGQGIIEVQFMDKTKGFIEVEKTERGYELPVKSSLLTQRGSIEMQLRIIQEGQEIFKSEITTFLINEAINATTTIPEQYPTWIDNLESLKLNLENAEKQRVEAEQGRVDAEKERAETFKQMGQAVDNAIGDIVDLQEAYDKNAQDKIKEFNDNAGNKLKEHNTNATNKMTEFNENVVKQTENIDKHVEDKITEYDEHTEEITNNINEIKEKDTNQDKLIEDLQTQIIELETENETLKNQFPLGQAEGENITLTDSSDMPFKLFRPGGNSWQKTRSGKNKLDSITKKEWTSNGVTFTPVLDDNGDVLYVNVNGTATKKTTTSLASFEPELNVNYIVSGCPIGGTSSTAYVYVTGSIDNRNGEETNAIWTTEGRKSYQVIIKAGATISNMKFYPMIRLATETDSTYEPYGAMPSPEFRSEIRNVGDNVNLFDYTKMEQGTLNYTDGTPSNGEYTVRSDYIPAKSDTDYTCSYTIVDSSFNYIFRIYEYDENHNFITRVEIFNKVPPHTIKTQSNTRYIRVVFYYDKKLTPTTYTKYFKNIKIEKGTKATPYSPYNCGNFNETVCNENLFDSKIMTNNDSLTTIKEDGTIILQNNSNPVGYKSALHTLKKLCPSLKVGDKAYLKIETTHNNKFIYINSVEITWVNGYFQIITEEMLNSVVGIYGGNNGQVDTLKIMVTLDKLATKYQPHQSQQYTFPLKPGQRMYKDSYLADDGVHHKRGQVVLDGTENWLDYAKQIDGYYKAYSTGAKTNSYFNADNSLCNYFKTGKVSSSTVSKPLNIICSDKNATYVSVSNDVASDLEEFKSWLSTLHTNDTPVVLQYPLAEEVIEPYTEEQQLVYNEIKKAHSYKNVTHIFSTDEIKPVLDVTYRKDLETMFNNINNAILGGN